MKLKIFDVDHGQCALAVLRNSNVMLFDCGHDSENDRRPSRFLPNEEGVQGIEWFFVTNYDEDHISDHPSLIRHYGDIGVKCLHRNTSVSPDQIRQIKLSDNGYVSQSMESACRMFERYTGSFAPGSGPSTGVASYSCFHNNYRSDFTDTNNLSLVTFVKEGAFKFVIPGDLERAGWERLLQDPRFTGELRDVTIFVASHHGRENGYCPGVFEFCSPLWIVMSDGPKQYETQEMVDIYASHAVGAEFGGQIRKVLTTRSDGDLTFTW